MSFLPHALFPFGPVSLASETPPPLPVQPNHICASLLLYNRRQPEESQRAAQGETGIRLFMLPSDLHKKAS